VRQRLEKELGREVLAISAATGAGLADLVRAVVERLGEVRREEAEQGPPAVIVIPPHRRNQENPDEVLT
jgi:hypothetical protein